MADKVTILALDPSPEFTGIVIGDYDPGTGKLEVWRHSTWEVQYIMRIWDFMQRLSTSPYQIHAIGLEKMFIGVNKKVGMDLVEASCMWKHVAWLVMPGVPVFEFQPTPWRKRAWKTARKLTTNEAKAVAEKYLVDNGIEASHHVGEACGIGIAAGQKYIEQLEVDDEGTNI